MTIQESIVKDVPQLQRPTVVCKKCGKKLTVDGADCLSHGWPKCHGETMYLVSKKDNP